MVEALDCDAEGATAQMLDHFVAIGYMILHDDSVIALRIVVPAVRIFVLVRRRVASIFGRLSCAELGRGSLTGRWLLGLDLLGTLSKVEDLWEVEYLRLLILSQMTMPKQL